MSRFSVYFFGLCILTRLATPCLDDDPYCCDETVLLFCADEEHAHRYFVILQLSTVSPLLDSQHHRKEEQAFENAAFQDLSTGY
mmetsp:Transcript_40/g.94  ORF Transcript_40/g.94 Transcript_40/m.94 type:complete len:84 (-) Transcript_40:1489-1740(-)